MKTLVIVNFQGYNRKTIFTEEYNRKTESSELYIFCSETVLKVAVQLWQF